MSRKGVPKAMLFQLSADTRLLYQHLQNSKTDIMISYTELGRVIGIGAIKGGFPALLSARRKLLADYGFVFANVRGMGIRRLSDDEIVEAAAADRHSLYRKSKKAATKLLMANYEALTPKNKAVYASELSLLGAITKLSKDRSEELLEHKVKGSQELPLLEVTAAIEG